MSAFTRKSSTPAGGFTVQKCSAGSGTRPGPSAQTFISTGHSDLDRIFGGGLPLGCVLLVLQDGTSQHHNILLQYFVAEGLNNHQQVLWAGPHKTLAQAKLPQLASDRKPRQATGQPQATPSDPGELRIAWQYRQYLGSAHSAEASTAQRQPQGQSSQSHVQRKAGAGASTPWPHDYDMSRSISAEQLHHPCLRRAGLEGPAALQSLAREVESFAQQLQTPPGPSDSHQKSTASPHEPSPEAHPPSSNVQSALSSPVGGREQQHPCVTDGGHSHGNAQDDGAPAAAQTSHRPRRVTFSGSDSADESSAQQPASGARDKVVGRIAVQDLGSLELQGLGWDDDSGGGGLRGGSALVQCLWRVARAVRDQAATAMVTFPPALHTPALALRMQHLCGAVIALETVRDDSPIVRLIPDPNSCVGLLHVHRLPCLNTIHRPQPDIPSFVLRHRRRRLAIDPVVIDPDAEAQAANLSGTSAHSASNLSCGGPAGSASQLDF